MPEVFRTWEEKSHVFSGRSRSTHYSRRCAGDSELPRRGRKPPSRKQLRLRQGRERLDGVSRRCGVSRPSRPWRPEGCRRFQGQSNHPRPLCGGSTEGDIPPWCSTPWHRGHLVLLFGQRLSVL